MRLVLLVLLATVPTATEFVARRDSLRPKTTDEFLYCGPEFIEWDRWNETYGPHEERPQESEQRQQMEACYRRIRERAERKRVADAAELARQEREEEEFRSRNATALAEQQRQEAAQMMASDAEMRAHRQNEAELARVRASATAQEEAASAWLCWYRQLKPWAKSEIEAERKYAREGGGIINKSKVYALQGKMREADAGAGRAVLALRKAHATPTACATKKMKQAVQCIRRSEAGEAVGVVGAFEDICDQAFAKLVLDGLD